MGDYTSRRKADGSLFRRIFWPILIFLGAVAAITLTRWASVDLSQRTQEPEPGLPPPAGHSPRLPGDQFTFNIQRMQLLDAVDAFADEASLTWIIRCPVPEEVMAGPLVGTLTIEQAAAELLEPYAIPYKFLRTKQSLGLIIDANDLDCQRAARLFSK